MGLLDTFAPLRDHRRSRTAGRTAERVGAISTADKVAFVNALSDAGLPVIEVTAFVHRRARAADGRCVGGARADYATARDALYRAGSPTFVDSNARSIPA